jgi:diguanylate cyclase (GGDEF)-like protein
VPGDGLAAIDREVPKRLDQVRFPVPLGPQAQCFFSTIWTRSGVPAATDAMNAPPRVGQLRDRARESRRACGRPSGSPQRRLGIVADHRVAGGARSGGDDLGGHDRRRSKGCASSAEDRVNVRSLSLCALVVSIVLIPLSAGIAVTDHNTRRSDLERRLADDAESHAASLDATFARARTITLITAHNAAFRDFYTRPGGRQSKVRAGSPYVAAANASLRYLETLFPRSIGELCFIDRSGAENARVVHGQPAPVSDLSDDEAGNPFFGPTFALRPGHVFQSRPYVSPDTHDWVVGNATPLAVDRAAAPAIVHYELSVESLRQDLVGSDDAFVLRVIDATSGRVVIDGRRPQRVGAPLGTPSDHRFAGFARTAKNTGVADVGGRTSAYRRLKRSDGNTNDWIVVASSASRTPSWIAGLGVLPGAMLALALLMLPFSLLARRRSRRELELAASTDSLTGLANRRTLVADLERRLERGADAPACVLMLFDLNGFKGYNDSFGHLAGDALLQRLGRALSGAVRGDGRAYRLGGDEFCILADAAERTQVELACALALSERGQGFEITASFGTALLPAEATDSTEALRIADQRMYAQKTSGRPTAGRQSTDVLLRALAERHPDLGEHTDGVASLARQVARLLGLPAEQLEQICHAAELHDIGKVAIPDAILAKPGPLNDAEWAFMRRHTLIGERIVTAAPALAPVARLVRASHERWDGGGYPDALAGEDIPLGARIVAVCDAFDAIVSDRAYRPRRTTAEALAELERCAGTQFDPAIVAAFAAALAEHEIPTAPA